MSGGSKIYLPSDEKEKKFKCPVCGKEFDSKKGMKIHKDQVHKKGEI